MRKGRKEERARRNKAKRNNERNERNERKERKESEMERILTGEQKTDELINRLENLPRSEFGKYLRELKAAPSISDFFAAYSEHYGISRADIVRRSGLSKSYAYEILNGTKENPSRNNLIALCLGAQMDLMTTQFALKLGGVGELYAKVPKDAAIILHINQEKWDVVELNIFLESNELELI